MRPTLNMEGAVIDGRYLLKDLIGEGGMGGVFRATDQTLQRDVAVKLLFSGDERDREQRVDRFLREARIAAAVQHKNIVNIIDFGSTEDGRPYMVMEYLEGETLAERLARSPAPTIEEVVEIVAQTLGGLARAHDAGVVHRDMKPENIFLVKDADGAYPKILDFGISRSVIPESGPSSALTTREGFLVGTPQYMSPEQARGLKDVGRATDIYSMGVILYEALTGKLPFVSEHVGDLIILIAAGNARTVSEVREELGEPLSEVVRKAMKVEREERYEDARAMRDALGEALERLDEEVRELTCPQRARRSLIPQKATAATVDARAAAPVSEEERHSAAHAKTLPATPSNPDAIEPPASSASASSSTPSIETPNAWTVDEKPQSGGTSRLVVVSMLALIIGAGVWVMTDSDPGPAAGPSAPDDGSEIVPPRDDPPANDPPEQLEPPPEPEPERITIALEDVPDEATITIDGEPVTGLFHTFDADGAEHVFEVIADGFEPFTATRAAEADASISVELVPLAEEPRAHPPRPAMMVRRMMRPAMMSTSSGMRPPAVLDDLDY
jgi:serine/threonine-protein kinase